MNCSGRVNDEPGMVRCFGEEGEREGDMEEEEEEEEEEEKDEDEGVGSVGQREECLDLDVRFSIDVVGMIVVDCVKGVGFEGMLTSGEEMEALVLLSTSPKDVLRKRDGSSGMAV